MPASLRFVLILLAIGVVATPVAIYFVYRNDEAQARTAAEAMTGGDAGLGGDAIAAHGCGACHVIAGVTGANGMVGPPLEGFAGRATIAGVLPNRPAELIRWLRDPQHVVPGNAMPATGLDEREARDVAAYLYTLR